MPLTLILGPMKSAKSLDLASHMLPFTYTKLTYGVFNPRKNVRDGKNIRSRAGIRLPAIKIKSLAEIYELDPRPEYIGIDEIHMFHENDAKVVANLLAENHTIYASGLDLDYQGVMFPIIQNLLSLGPREVRFKRAVCEYCRKPDAIFTQVYEWGEPVLSGRPSVIPDDKTGRYTYKPVCRHCFKRSEEAPSLFSSSVGIKKNNKSQMNLFSER